MKIITYCEILDVIKNYISVEIFDRLNKKNIENVDALLIPKSSVNFAYDLIYELGPKVSNVEFLSNIPKNNSESLDFFNNHNIEYFRTRTILLIDSILDSGYTLNLIVQKLKELDINNLITCTLIKKDRKDKVCCFDNTDHIFGFQISDYFVVGYGLDYEEKFRNIKNIFDYNEIKTYLNEKSINSFYEFSNSLEGEKNLNVR